MGAILKIEAFKLGNLSKFHPILSVGYIFEIFYLLLLKEALTLEVIIGTSLILFGVALLGVGKLFY